MQYTLFLELLQVALGTRDRLSRNPSAEEWNQLYLMAKKQAITGFIFTALDDLSFKGQKPPKSLVLEWIGVSEQITAKNRVINHRCVEISNVFKEDGFGNCILKGQGNALSYPKPLSRSPGDIDIWLSGPSERIRDYVKKRFPNAADSVLHIDYPFFNDVMVEVHYRPSMLRSFLFNKRIQTFYDENLNEQFEHRVLLSKEEGYICIPTPEVNIIMQLSHVMGHFFEEGIGLRQIIDLFYLLKSNNFNQPQMNQLLHHLGMYSFTRAIMWVLHEHLGLDEKYLLLQPDKKRGRLVMEEILKDGNFGHYDNRSLRKLYSVSPLVYKIARNIRYFFFFPRESLISPLFGIVFRS